MTVPCYVELLRRGELSKRADDLYAHLKSCDLCPRMCAVDRTAGETGYCRVGEKAIVSSYGPHPGEEPELVGRKGSGTIFFAACNLLCIFCQNADISHGMKGAEQTDEQIAEKMLRLQAMGCHNINLVTPTHFVPQIARALAVAAEMGLRLPIVYNSGGYDRVEILRELDGIIDIYMPDMKFSGIVPAEKYMNAPDYPNVVKAALKEMHRQVGDLQIDAYGVATRGLLIRHLVMPGGLAGSEEFARFIAEEVSCNTYVNIMPQYRPEHRAREFPELVRRDIWEQFHAAQEVFRLAGVSWTPAANGNDR